MEDLNDKALSVFNNPEFGSVRVIEIDGEPWFVGKDVASALGYSDPSSAVSKNVDAEDKTTLLLEQDGSHYKSKTTIINESGVYDLILGSKLKTAKVFKHWITHDVIPSIRKTGSYSIEPQLPQTYSDALRALADEWDKNQKLLAENSTMKPKAEYFDDLVDRKTYLGIRATAKELGIKQTDFVDYLIKNKYVYRDQNGKIVPYAEQVTKGNFVLKECKGKSNSWSGQQTLTTPRGREEFRLLMK